MEWQRILAFYQVSKLGSFTKAAEANFRTQSALSQQIKALEEEIGYQLFERIGKRKIKLTSAGESFLKFCVTILDSHDQLKAELKEKEGNKKGRLKIAAPFDTLFYLLPDNLLKFTSNYPDVELAIIDCAPLNVLDYIKYGDIDFGIVMECKAPNDLVALRWKKVNRYLMTPIGHPLTRVKRLTIKQLADYPLILPPKDYQIRIRFDEKLEQFGLKCRVIIESPNVALRAECVEMGLGISIASEGACSRFQREKRNIEFMPLKNHLKEDHLALVMRKDKKLSSYQKLFINIFLEKQLMEI
jgi:DNA-binding transcriptional LysR family regulator